MYTGETFLNKKLEVITKKDMSVKCGNGRVVTTNVYIFNFFNFSVLC